MRSIEFKGSIVLRGLSLIVLSLIVLFMLFPVGVIVVLSFSNEPQFHFPPSAWGLHQYRGMVDSLFWRSAILRSFEVAVPTALLAVAIAIPGVYALYRTSLPFRRVLLIASLSPLVMPIVAYAVALYIVYARAHIVGTTGGLVIAHTIRALPFVVVIAGSAINRIPRELELVAMALGASRSRAVIGITLRLLMPAIAASLIFAFLTSFDEAVFVTFLGGPDLITLPKAIFDSEQQSVDPVITAIATVLMLCTGAMMLIAVYWRAPRQNASY